MNTDRSGNEQYKEIDRTVEAVVSDLEVRLEVVVARSDVVEVVVEHPDAARSPARAVPIHDLGPPCRSSSASWLTARASTTSRWPRGRGQKVETAATASVTTVTETRYNTRHDHISNDEHNRYTNNYNTRHDENRYRDDSRLLLQPVLQGRGYNQNFSR